MAGWDYRQAIWDTAGPTQHAKPGLALGMPDKASEMSTTGPLPAGDQLFGGTGPLRISAAKPETSACSDGPGFPG